jgi:hypothetical protein
MLPCGVKDRLGYARLGRYMIRYWGFYANAARGKRRKKTDERGQTSPGPGQQDADDAFTRHARLTWATLLKRVYEVDPLLCRSPTDHPTSSSFSTR